MHDPSYVEPTWTINNSRRGTILGYAESVTGPATVTGELLFPANAPSVDAATLRITVEDVSRVDAASQVIAEEVIHGVGVRPRRPPLDFSVALETVDDAAHYNVRAHIDSNDSGEVTLGDLLSTQAHPVLTFGAPDHVTVPLQHVL